MGTWIGTIDGNADTRPDAGNPLNWDDGQIPSSGNDPVFDGTLGLENYPSSGRISTDVDRVAIQNNMTVSDLTFDVLVNDDNSNTVLNCVYNFPQEVTAHTGTSNVFNGDGWVFGPLFRATLNGNGNGSEFLGGTNGATINGNDNFVSGDSNNTTWNGSANEIGGNSSGDTFPVGTNAVDGNCDSPAFNATLNVSGVLQGSPSPGPTSQISADTWLISSSTDFNVVILNHLSNGGDVLPDVPISWKRLQTLNNGFVSYGASEVPDESDVRAGLVYATGVLTGTLDVGGSGPTPADYGQTQVEYENEQSANTAVNFGQTMKEYLDAES